MKTSLKTFAIIAMAVISFSVQAQKIAYLELDTLLSAMPEMIEAKKISADYYKQLETTLSTMQKELNDKLTEYQANQSKYTDLIKQTKEKELQDLNQRIQDFQVQAQQDFQKRNMEITKPINEKAKKAIEKVARAKGYKIVLDSGIGTILYSDPVDDILLFVKTELGIK
ncbi:MAG: OmpH family outer membrane protein [Bacteroidota bacterium]